MKKIIIVCGVILAGAVAYGIFALVSGVSHDAMMVKYETAASGGAGSGAALSPSQVTVGVVESSRVSKGMAELLHKRLTALGFAVQKIDAYENSAADASDRATIILREQSPDILALLERTVFTSTVYRREVNGAQKADVLLYSWQVKDIQWGDLAEEASALVPPAVLDRASIAVSVLNASGTAGEAGRIASILKEQGFEQVEAGNATEAPEVTTVYYQKEHKTIAEDILPLLGDNGYPSAVVVEDDEQDDQVEQSIVIVLVVEP